MSTTVNVIDDRPNLIIKNALYACISLIIYYTGKLVFKTSGNEIRKSKKHRNYI